MVPFKRRNPRFESYPKRFRLQVATELDNLIPVLQWFETNTQPFLPETAIWQCKVALAEGFTNTVRYAHQNLPSTTPIDLELIFFPQSLEMRIWDRGQPFDLSKKLEEIKQSPIDPLDRESDRGLLFMQALTDSLQYIRLEDNRNCLIMYKKLVISY